MQFKEIGEIIQARREELSLNQDDLVEMAGITKKTLYMIETGKGNPSIVTLSSVLEVLGLEMNIQIKKTLD